MDKRQELLNLFDFKNKTDQHHIKTLLGDKNLIVYGAGEGYIAFKNAVLDRYNITPLYVIDTKFEKEKVVNGIKCVSLRDLRITEEVKNSLIVVTIGDPKVYDEIYNLLHFTYAFDNIIKSTDIFEFNIHHTHTHKKLESEEKFFYSYRKDTILKAFDSLADDLSKEVFLSLMKIYMTHIPEVVPNRNKSEQYFPVDVHLSKGYDRFINCGAFDGDTIKQLVETIGRVDSLVCFEPDQNNYNLLVKYIQKDYIQERVFTGKRQHNVLCLPCGVYSDERSKTFISNNSLSSSISSKGLSIIQTVSLDNVLPTFNPTFINMDIEGAEYDALIGARNMIKEYEPDLAISVYHYPEDLWNILIYINSLGVNYKYYLRNYSGFTYETILYCTVGD